MLLHITPSPRSRRREWVCVSFASIYSRHSREAGTSAIVYFSAASTTYKTHTHRTQSRTFRTPDIGRATKYFRRNLYHLPWLFHIAQTQYMNIRNNQIVLASARSPGPAQSTEAILANVSKVYTGAHGEHILPHKRNILRVPVCNNNEQQQQQQQHQERYTRILVTRSETTQIRVCSAMNAFCPSVERRKVKSINTSNCIVKCYLLYNVDSPQDRRAIISMKRNATKKSRRKSEHYASQALSLSSPNDVDGKPKCYGKVGEREREMWKRNCHRRRQSGREKKIVIIIMAMEYVCIGL